MDWFNWLAKTNLEASLVYEYGLAFGKNELEEEDIGYFNHEFLQSMGISIAKHRLEILKLAKKHPKYHVLKHPISKLLLVLKNTKNSLANYIATLVHHRDEDRSLILLPNQNKKTKFNITNKKMKISKGGAISYSSRWRKSMMMRNNNSRKFIMVNNNTNNNNNNNNNEERLMLTNGDYIGDYLGDYDTMVVSTPKLESFSSPLMYNLQKTKENKLLDNHDHDHDYDVDEGAQEEVDDQYWSPTLEEIKWDAMFQDLKPT